jgi:hypothetical protein
MGSPGGTALKRRPQHNVTFSTQDFLDKPFPCPLCNMELRLKISCKQKPYCMCLECGIQIFFRGQSGIERLLRMIQSEEAVVLQFSGPARAISLYSRLQYLKRQKEALEKKQGLVFRDSDRDQVIEAVEAEKKHLRKELQDTKEDVENKNEKSGSLRPRF